MNAAERLNDLCLLVLADPQAYRGGHNGVAAAQEATGDLLRWLDTPNDGRSPWRCMPQLLDGLLELHERDKVGYTAFLEGTLFKPDPDRLNLEKISGLWHLSGVLRSLSDDHDYSLGGEGAEQQLMFQDRLPAWRPGVRPANVLEAVQARLTALVPAVETAAGAAKRVPAP